MAEIPKLKSSPTLARILSVITVAASIAVILSLYFQVKKPRRELEATILNAEHVGGVPKVSGLSLELTYQNRKIPDFWIARIRVRNTGDVSLIGRGPSKNILSEGITIQLADDFEIIDQPQPTETQAKGGFTYEVSKIGPNALGIYFGQWRIGEEATATLYLTRKPDSQKEPTLEVREREIIDGDVRIAAAGAKAGHTALDFLHPAVARILRYLAIFGLAVLLVLDAFVVIGAWWSYFRQIGWRQLYLADFKAHINQLESLTPQQRMLYTARLDDFSDVTNLPESVWTGFKGPKPPGLLFTSWFRGLIATVAGIFLAVSFTVGIIGLIGDRFS